MTELKRCPFCGGDNIDIIPADIITGTQYWKIYCYGCGCTQTPTSNKEDAVDTWNTRPNPWHTGTPTEKGLYVVLTKVSMNGVSSSEGTYILDYWDGYSFQYLKRKALVFSLIEPDIYSWVKWQKIEEK